MELKFNSKSGLIGVADDGRACIMSDGLFALRSADGVWSEGVPSPDELPDFEDADEREAIILLKDAATAFLSRKD